ncbi:MAG: hypothetical protein J3Q66DRAFT_341554 [Benniella sp.]|nr:MAG: hypothetical protein J3Q66DRAFT_341554 [Benniella sp.]
MLSRIAGNMLNLDVGTVKRKIDSNEYDDEIYHDVQPNGKRACNTPHNHNQSFATFGSTPQTPTEYSQGPLSSGWSSHTTTTTMIPSNGFTATGYQTPESSVAASPFAPSMDMDMETEVSTQDPHAPAPMTIQTTNAMLNTAISAPTVHQSSTLLPSALLHPGPSNNIGNSGPTEFVPVHGRSMEIPSYARVPLNEVRKYREQRWSSCIYAADNFLGQGMMV